LLNLVDFRGDHRHRFDYNTLPVNFTSCPSVCFQKVRDDTSHRRPPGFAPGSHLQKLWAESRETCSSIRSMHRHRRLILNFRISGNEPDIRKEGISADLSDAVFGKCLGDLKHERPLSFTTGGSKHRNALLGHLSEKATTRQLGPVNNVGKRFGDVT
jgi:hypothetical protein